MEQKIIDFTNLLRKSGDPGLGRRVDRRLRGLDELSLSDREVFKDALRTTMVKRGEDIATFDQLFDLYWSAFYDSLRETPSTTPPARWGRDDEIDLDQLMKAIQEGMQQMDGDGESWTSPNSPRRC